MKEIMGKLPKSFGEIVFQYFPYLIREKQNSPTNSSTGEDTPRFIPVTGPLDHLRSSIARRRSFDDEAGRELEDLNAYYDRIKEAKEWLDRHNAQIKPELDAETPETLPRGPMQRHIPDSSVNSSRMTSVDTAAAVGELQKPSRPPGPGGDLRGPPGRPTIQRANWNTVHQAGDQIPPPSRRASVRQAAHYF